MSDQTVSLQLASIPRQRVGDHEIHQLIARGGMAAVFEATHLPTGRAVALKMLRADVPEAAEAVERFRREARLARLLAHPHIVEVLGVVEEGEVSHLVMELVRGSSLAALADRGAVHVRRALVIVRQVLEGLGHAHAAGVIHRDVKPANVMVARVGEPGRERDHAKLLDFGVAKLVGEAAEVAGADRLTRTGLVFGTPAYLSPEQGHARPLDGRTDLYALGVVAFELLTGRVPFRSPDPATVVRMHAAAPIPTLASAAPGRPWCTPEVEALVRGALAKRPEDRFADAAAMIAAVERALLSIDHLPAGV
ncbi:MAG: serine/threonine protein kinase [Deltaproteobacteria bacterium]|nr:serine/threonine protein kinase [Deltaproteobacteria bacterium]